MYLCPCLWYICAYMHIYTSVSVSLEQGCLSQTELMHLVLKLSDNYHKALCDALLSCKMSLKLSGMQSLGASSRSCCTRGSCGMIERASHSFQQCSINESICSNSMQYAENAAHNAGTRAAQPRKNVRQNQHTRQQSLHICLQQHRMQLQPQPSQQLVKRHYI